MSPDVFGTADLRAAVLGTWRASPARLREDANHEEDQASGYYRDRVIVELAQNAADAAARAGVPGRLLLRLTAAADGWVLLAANTGAPLDAAGVASLASMRASAKRDDGQTGPATVGRFGVGFAAVRAVADEVEVVSTTGGVRFSLTDTARLLADAGADVPALAAEVARRKGSLPALRLPLPAEVPPGTVPAGYDTAVVAHLRDAGALGAVRSWLRDVDDLLLLALPALVEVVVEDAAAEHPLRRVADVGSRWRVVTVGGVLDLALVADRPVEERVARAWQVTWALPRDGRVRGVLHAPTPTDEAITLPAALVATLPLDPGRRHVVPGPVTDAVLAHAADGYAGLVADVAAAGEDPFRLVPGGLPAGRVDAALHALVVERLGRTPLLASPAGTLLAPRDAVLLAGDAGADPALAGALAGWVDGLVHVPAAAMPAARRLGAQVRDLADVVEALPADPDPDRWRLLYAALEPAAVAPAVREVLTALPVPLADGRLVRGVPGLALVDLTDRATRPDGSLSEALGVLGAWGLRVVHPRAAHPLLARLGAQQLDSQGLLGHPAVRQAVLDQADDDDLALAERVTDAVLALVAAAFADGGGTGPDTAAWLGLLTLDAADGEPTAARGLVLPGSPAARLLDPRVVAPVATDVVERWGAQVLTAVGVRADLVVARVADVIADPVALDLDSSDATGLVIGALDGFEEYVGMLAGVLGSGAWVPEVVAVADLDAVDDWPAALRRMAERPDLRRALVEAVRAQGSDATAPSYTAWWVRARAGLGLDRPFAATGADALTRRLLPVAPEPVAGLDGVLQRALGGVVGLAEVGDADWPAALDGLGPVGTGVDPRLACAVWQAWSRPGAVIDLERLPAVVGDGRIAVVRATDAAVADAPMWLQRTDLAAVLPVPPERAGDVARGLDLPLVSDLAAGEVGGDPGEVVATPEPVRLVLATAPARWTEHEDLRVDGVPVGWWVDGAGPGAVVHAGHTAGLARGLAQAAGRWPDRHVVEAVLTDPARGTELAIEAALDGP